MHFLTPIWLLATAAIIIPVVIHLWNIREGKTLKVGSISLIEASSRKRSRSFKLIDLLLLLLRCLLLISLAFVLALPFFIKHNDNTKVKGWLLIPKENLKEAYQQYKPTADSLIKAGYAFHYFDNGFPVADFQAALADTAKTSAAKTVPYWNLLQQLDQKVPSTLPVYLITPNRLNNFTGKRPQVALNLHWKTITTTDSVSTWIQSAWFTANKDVRVVQGSGTPSGTKYTVQTVSSGETPNSPYTVSANNGQPVISLKNGTQPPVQIDSATVKIALYADKNVLDAAYLNAALSSVAEFTQRKTSIKPYNPNAGGKQDWLFWLSDKPLDKTVASQFSNVLVYEGGKVTNLNSRISSGDSYAITQGQLSIPLFKEINNKNAPGETVWHDGFGNVVLSMEQVGQTKLYHFYSRFNPSWSDLVWNTGFPKMMLQLMMNEQAATPQSRFDRRTIAMAQLQPELITETHTLQGKGNLPAPLTNYFWVILALLFLAERWLAHYHSISTKEKGLQNG